MAGREIRELRDAELGAYLEVVAYAYPGMRMMAAEERERRLERLRVARDRGGLAFYGAFEDGRLVGVMRQHDFMMQFRSLRTLVGGVGEVAVDLRYKRSHVALDMMRAFLGRYRQRGAPLAVLYPFRHDFYRDMGFGYGSPVHAFRIAPEALPAGGDRSGVDYLGTADVPAAAAAYEREMLRTNGLFERPLHVWQQLLSEPRLRVVGARATEGLGGYLIAQLEATSEENFLRQDLLVREIAWDAPEHLLRLLAFLRAQSDQVERIVISAVEDDWAHLLADPRDDSGRMLPKAVCHQVGTFGLGVMYRVLDVRRVFEALKEHRFDAAGLRVAIRLEDSLMPDNAAPLRVSFDEGWIVAIDRNVDEVDATVAMDVADFSSAIVGAARLASLARFGRVEVSPPERLGELDALFLTPRPRCWTDF